MAWSEEQLRAAYVTELGYAQQREDWDRVHLIEGQLRDLSPSEPTERMPWEDDDGIPRGFHKQTPSWEWMTPEKYAEIEPVLKALNEELARAQIRKDGPACRAITNSITLTMSPWLADLPEDHPSRIDLTCLPWEPN